MPDSVFWDPFWNSAFTSVRTEKDGLQRFVLNDAQSILAQHFVEARRRKKWLVHLKARKEGSSTFVAQQAFQRVVGAPGQRVAIVGYKGDNAKTLAQMALLCYDKFHPDFKHVLAARTKSGFLSLPALASKIVAAGALDPNPETGETNQLVIATEVAKWVENRAATVWDSLRNSIAEGGMLIAESTAFRQNDPHHETWKEAQEADSRWMQCFIGWHQCAKYSRLPPPGWSPSAQVRDYADSHPLVSVKHLYWMESEGLGRVRYDMQAFQREYPCDEHECWAVVGAETFDRRILKSWYDDIKKGGKIANEPDAWTQYAPLLPGRKYLFVIDPATELTERDFCGGIVIDLESRDIMADYYARMDVEDAVKRALHLVEQSRAEGVEFSLRIMVEANGGTGDSIIGALRRAGLDHTTLFTEVRGRDGREKYGWWSDGAKKSTAISELATAIKEDQLSLPSIRLVNQLMGFDGRWEARRRRDSGGGHYDLVSALAMSMWYIHKHIKVYKPTHKRPKLPANPEPLDLFRRYQMGTNYVVGGGVMSVQTAHLNLERVLSDAQRNKGSSRPTRWGRHT